jgi:hypothetical protein
MRRCTWSGYPALLPETGDGCYPYIPILPEDVHYLRGIQKALNQMLEAQVAAGGVGYVDWYAPSIGHDACQPPGFAWVNGAVVVPPSYPAHPNQLGTAGGAAAVLEALERDRFAFAS